MPAQFVSLTPLVPAGESLPNALAFYTTHLGFSIAWQAPGIAGIRRGNVEFNLLQSTDKHWADNTSFSIGVDDLDALYAEYKSIPPPARVGLLEVKAWGRREFHLIEPAGVCIQFYQRATNHP